MAIFLKEFASIMLSFVPEISCKENTASNQELGHYGPI
jgi:hypothetical protein